MCARGEEPAAEVGARPPKLGVGAGVGVEEGEMGEVSNWAAVGCARGWIKIWPFIIKSFRVISHLHNCETSGILGSIIRHMCLLSIFLDKGNVFVDC
jgi:hypothetical protein